MSPLLAINNLALPSGFIFGGTGTGELILIFVVVLLLFGPRKLPEVARMIGKILSQLRNASNEFRDQVMRIEDEVKSGPAVDVDAKEVKPDAGETEEGSGDDHGLSG